jgi:hypothetical protein
MKTNNLLKILFLLAIFIVLASCADVTPIEDCVTGKPYGFLGGLWHGIIAPISFIGSIFMDDVAMYAINNNGGWYDFGFVIGAGILFGGGSKATNRR